MNRRTFLLLTGATSGAMLAPPFGVSRPPARVGRLRVTLDDERRWSLWYQDGAAPVPLLEPAALGAWIGDRLVTLADLEDTAIGTRRPPSGESLVVRGRAAGVVLEAEFVTGEPGPAPQASVTVSIYPDRYLPTCRGIRYFDVPAAALLPGTDQLLALVNSYQSSSGCQVAHLPPGPGELVSHAALGLTRDRHGLGLAFDPGEPGEAKVRLTPERLVAVSEWLPARPLRPQGDSATLRLAYRPDADGLAALDSLFEPASPVDHERLASLTVPAGWCSWYELLGRVTEDDIIANLEFCAANFDRRYFRYVQLDDGYERSAGDWEPNDKFPHGHRWLTDRIHARGLKAGLWMAPFAVAERSGIPDAHADWLLPDANGPVVFDTREEWGGRIYGLDGAHPQVQEWLYALTRRAVRDWGYDYLKLDFLHWATGGTAHHGGLTHAEAYRRGLGAIRDGLGPEVFLLASGAPLQHARGLVNGMRIGADVHASWGGIQTPARAAALRSFYHRRAWLNDPDCLLVRPPLTEREAQAWASVVALSGGLTLFSDDLPKLPPERVAILQRTLPVAPVAGRPVGAVVEDREIAPAMVVGGEAYPLGGTWRFRTGDDPSYAARDYADDVWEVTAVPQPWEHDGRPEYDGYGWYRVRVALPGRATGRSPVHLELGKIDDVDETFVNGVKVGQSGEFPPNYRSERLTYRRYRVPADALNWGGENVVAIRVYDGGGGGGLWNARRDRPASIWVAEGATRWWTVALVNWDDEVNELAVPLADLGVAGQRFAAYDVWQAAPLPDVRERLVATLEPHAALTLGLRPVATHPQVIGTTRHVVQGAVDLGEESWDAATRTLRGRSTAQDGRGYMITIALPRGLRASACQADIPCRMDTLQSGHVVLTWPDGVDGRDIQWEVRFRTVSRR